MQHLRGVAPQMDVYRRPPLPAILRPILPGLWSPSRSFDPHADIAAVVKADAVRTLCVGHPDGPRPPQPAVAVPPISRRGHRSVPLLHPRRSRSNRQVGDPSGGHGARWFIAHRACCHVARDREVAGPHRVTADSLLRERLCRGHRRAEPEAFASSRAVDDQVPRTQARFCARCSDPVRIRQNSHPCGGICEVAVSRLPGGDGLAPPFAQAWVFPVENGGGAVGLDPSGACVRSCFSQVSTMVGHPCG